jgi:hypothetical protein
MHCRHYEKQTKGEVREVELEGLTCQLAEHCRRKGICVLSPFSTPELAKDQEVVEAEEHGEDEDNTGLKAYFEILRFKNALGFQWQRYDGFTEAVEATAKYRESGQPKVVRRVEIFQLPD